MPRVLFFCLLLIGSQSLLSQTEEIRYYQSSSFQTLEPKYSRYKRTYLPQGEYLIVKSYHGKTLLDSGIYIGFESLDNLDNFFRFHAKGQNYVSTRTNFTGKEARLTMYYSDGSPKEMGHYVTDSSAIHQVWNADGTPILSDGYGSTEREKEDGTLSVLIYENYAVAEALLIRPNKGDSINLRPDKRARPKEGLRAFHTFLSQNLEYPQEALEMGIETTLDVSFIVDKTGKLKEFKVTNNYKPQVLTKKTLKKLLKLPDWNPAFHKGKPVKTAFIIPIVFRLED